MTTVHFSSCQKQSGATLVEVLVSVLLLTFGVLGLMAAQLRSVASISEAESRNIIAMAAENYAEAMQANPQLQRLATTSGGATTVVRRFPNYMNNQGMIINVHNPTQAGHLPTVPLGDNVTKQALANYHREVFVHAIRQLPNVTELFYTVCLDSSDGEPVYANGGMVDRCAQTNNGNTKTMIKVVWVVRGDNPASDPVAYSYKLQVPQ